MTSWTNDELQKVGGAEELQIAPRRPNGELRQPVPIWVVRVDDHLYVRSFNGPGGAWYRAAMNTHQGQVRAGGVQKDVNLLSEGDPRVRDQVDAAYRAKYGRYP